MIDRYRLKYNSHCLTFSTDIKGSLLYGSLQQLGSYHIYKISLWQYTHKHTNTIIYNVGVGVRGCGYAWGVCVCVCVGVCVGG